MPCPGPGEAEFFPSSWRDSPRVEGSPHSSAVSRPRPPRPSLRGPQAPQPADICISKPHNAGGRGAAGGGGEGAEGGSSPSPPPAPPPHFRSQRWSFVKMLASGLLGDDDITVSHTGAGLWGAGVCVGGTGSEPILSDHTGARAHSHSRAPATVAHTVRRAPAAFTRTLPRSSLPGLRIGPRAAAHCRRCRHHGCQQQLLRSAVQQPRPPAGPPRAPGCRQRARQDRRPCSRLACSPGRSEDGRLAVPAASPSL